jgi:hypothetical protein
VGRWSALSNQRAVPDSGSEFIDGMAHLNNFGGVAGALRRVIFSGWTDARSTIEISLARRVSHAENIYRIPIGFFEVHNAV